jgi:hypothetical protein
MFDNPIGARQTALWCHDHSYPGMMNEARASRIDHVLTLSQWQHDRFERLYPYLDGKLRIVRNGITTVGFDGVDRYPDADSNRYPDPCGFFCKRFNLVIPFFKSRTERLHCQQGDLAFSGGKDRDTASGCFAGYHKGIKSLGDY